MDSICQYCGVQCPTVQGLRSHLSQTKLCRQRQFEEYAAEESSLSSESESESASADDPLSASEDVNKDLYGMAGLQNNGSDAEQSDPDEDSYFAVDPPRPDLETPTNNPINTPAGASNSRKRPAATVEEVEDEDARYYQSFPEDRCAGAIFEKCQTHFQKMREEQEKQGHAPWEPFESEDEWELARWLMTSGLSQKKTDEYLKLKKVRLIFRIKGLEH
jgi:hypothetical protein